MKAPVLAPTRPVAWSKAKNTWIMNVEDQRRVVDGLSFEKIKPEWKMFYPKD